MSSIFKLTSNKVKIQYIIGHSLFVVIYLLTPLVIMRFIDAVVSGDYCSIVRYALCYFATFLLTQVISYFFSIIVGKVEADNFANFFSRVNTKLGQIDIEGSGIDISELNQQLGQNYEIAQQFFFVKPASAVFSAINVVAIFGIMFCLNWKITLVLCFFVPCSFLASKAFEKKLYHSSDENLANKKNVRDYTTDQFYLSKVERFLTRKQLGPIKPLLEKFRMVHQKNNKIKSEYLYFFTYCFLNFAILIVIVAAGFLTYDGVISIGVLYAFQNYVSQLWDPCESLMSFSADYQQVKPSLMGLSKLLNVTTIEYSTEKIENISLCNFAVLDRNGEQLTREINYTFQKGYTYIVKGENGSGKTSLVEAILGFNKRYLGDIRINGKKILSDDVVYIPADAYISTFYDIDSDKLSSGQRKFEQIKLCLSTNKSVYIFDEPTNFIDSSKKADIIEMISQLNQKSKLIIIISHDHELTEKYQNILNLGKI